MTTSPGPDPATTRGSSRAVGADWAAAGARVAAQMAHTMAASARSGEAASAARRLPVPMRVNCSDIGRLLESRGVWRGTGAAATAGGTPGGIRDDRPQRRWRARSLGAEGLRRSEGRDASPRSAIRAACAHVPVCPICRGFWNIDPPLALWQMPRFTGFPPMAVERGPDAYASPITSRKGRFPLETLGFSPLPHSLTNVISPYTASTPQGAHCRPRRIRGATGALPYAALRRRARRRTLDRL